MLYNIKIYLFIKIISFIFVVEDEKVKRKSKEPGFPDKYKEPSEFE